MATGKYDHLIVTEPLYEDMPNEDVNPGEAVTATTTFMSAAQVEGAKLHVSWGIISSVPQGNSSYVAQHDHPFDEVLFFQGFNPADPTDLGAEIELALEDEMVTINSTCGIWIPAGMKHCPLTVTKVDRPYGLAAMLLNGRYETMGYSTPDDAPRELSSSQA
jgi:hypothetical protein